MNEKEFNLLYEKWIKVRYLDGTVKEVGIVDILKDAHIINGFAGELPTQDLAIMRVLLAALYSIYLRMDYDGNERVIKDSDQAISEWANIWNKSKFKSSIIDMYFNQYEDRFFLIHPQRPFYQAPIGVGTDYSAAKLNSEVSESGNKHRLFIPLSGDNKAHLNYAQASRWLVHAMAFDDASAKQKNKENGHIQMSVGWLGQIGPVYVEGNNLFETLMLNLVLVNDDEVMVDGHPIWESESIRVGERTIVPLPDGPAELLTLQSRRILLKFKNGLVEGCTVLGGDIVSSNNAILEQMTAWKNDESKNEYSPKRLREDVSMWRDFSSLMIRSKDSSADYRIPGIINWVMLLNRHGYIPYNMIKIRTTGIIYGNMFSSIQNIIDDSLSINIQLLSDLNAEWNYRIGKAVETIDLGVKHLGILQSSLLECNGFRIDDSNLKQRRDYTKSEAYYRIDQPFRRWLSSINPTDDDIDTSVAKLYYIIRNILLTIGKELIGDINCAAMIGKEKINPANGNKYHINAFKSFNKFENNIYETFRSVIDDE